MVERFTERVRQVLVLAQEPGALQATVERVGLGIGALREYAESRFEHRGRPRRGGGIPYGPDAQLLIREANGVADEFANDRVSQDHLALATLRSSEEARMMLGAHAADVRQAVETAVAARRGASIGDFDGL